MFKKSLVALAVSGAVAGVANAADVTTTTKDISVQGVDSLTTVTSNAIEVLLEAEYSFGDILTFTWNGAEVDPANLPLSVSVDLTCTSDTMTLGLLGTSTVNEAVYRVTELDTANCGTTIGGTAQLAADGVLEFDTATVLASGSVSVTYTSVTGSGSINIEGPETGALFTTSDQFSLAGATALDGVIDVDPVTAADSRRVFTTGDDDVLTVDLTDDGASLAYPATLADYTINLYGDFSFLDTDAVTADVQPALTNITNNFLTQPDSVTATMITWTGVPGDVTVTFDMGSLPAGNVIPTQTFTADVIANYTDWGTDEAVQGVTPGTGTQDVVLGAGVGEWTINGSIVNIPYLAMGPNTQSILRHTNIGTATADISLRYMVEGVHTSWQDAGVIVSDAAPGLTNLLAQTEAALLAGGYDRAASGFKVALEFTTNAPADDITVFAGMKISADEQDRISVGPFSSN